MRALVVAQTQDLVIPAGGGSLSVLGVYTLEFPANAVCDPDAADTQAGYAAQEWDASCTPANRDVAIRATGKWSNGTLYVDFQPALRFVPSVNVRISTDVFASAVRANDLAGVMEGFPIYYSPAIDGSPVIDALSDPSARTTVVGSTGLIFRRIKHFSGYQIVFDGTPCDPNEGNPDCVWVDDET